VNARNVAVAVLVSAVLAVRALLFGTDTAVVLYYLVGFAAAAVAWWGAVRQPATARAIARPIAVGVTLSALGDAVWWVEAQVGVRGGGFDASDVLNLAGYASLGLGLLRASARRGRSRQQQIAGSIDALVVFVAVVVVLWQFAIAQVVSDPSLPLGSRLIWALNPALDAALVALVFRLVATGVRRLEGPLTFALGAGVWLVADIAYLVDGQFRSGTAWLGTGWLLGAVLLALACGMNRRPGAPETPDVARGGMGRLAVCLSALLVPAAMEAYIDLTGAEGVPGLVLVSTTVLTALVFARTALLVAGESRARARLRSQQRYSAALAAHSSDAVVVLSRDGRLLSDPATLLDIVQVDGDGQVTADELIGLLGGDPREAHVMFERAVLAAGEVVDAELLCERGGVPFWIGIRAADLTDDPDVGGVVIHVTDISDRKRAEEALAHQAFHDALTGLANRALFADRVEQALRRGVRGQGQPAVVFIDLDGFKGVNDTLGHSAGDALLREVARRLRSVVRLDDTVSRLGGDEFAVLVEQAGSGPEGAVATAERVLATLAVPFTLERQTVTISGSVGIAVGSAGTCSDSLIGDADIAMYAAKMAGRSRAVVFDAGMRASAVAARELEQELRNALAADEFRLVYQPVIDLSDDSITGFEALLRWNSPVLGPVPPDRFVPVAEASGLIEPIGAWALREACATAAAWRAEHGRDLTMAVNVSAVQLTSAHLVDHITEALTASGLPPSALVLEVTETALVADPERASECLAALRALGLRLALDDFGTGYSSLAHLRQFTVDVLKIDRSFVGTIGEDGVLPPIVRGMIDLGRTLGLEIVAEGVETDAQRRLLVEGRCDLAQGYLFARPLEPGDASLLLVAAARAGA
jgi:diguanylate cyclase (GGDEF)-like protein